MKAANLYKPGEIRCEEVPIPEPGPGEVLIKVKACGVCGSDIPRVMRTGTYSFPTIPGHEFSGEVMDYKDYWARKETEIGESVEAKFYCTYISGDWPVKGPQTGVLFFSRSTLYFQSFFSSKSLASLFQPRRQQEISESHAFKLQLKNLWCSYDSLPKNLIRRLFAAPEQSLVVHLGDGNRNAGSYRFKVHRDDVETLANLINTSRSEVLG